MSDDLVALVLTVFGPPGESSLTFHPGQEVTGTVELFADEEFSILGVRAQLTGYASIEVKKLVSGPENPSKLYLHNSQKESYLDIKEMVLGDFTTPIKIPHGVTKLPFKFQLPAIILPCSYVRPDAKVEYLVEAVMKKLPDSPGEEYIRATETIEIDTPFQLSRYKSEPSKASGTENIVSGCCCCTSDPLEVVVKTDRYGYDIAGDVIELEVSVDNKSGRKVKDVTAELFGISFFNVKAENDVHTAEFPEDVKRWGKVVPPRSTGVWKVQLPIPKPQPQLRPSHLAGGCSLIELSWKIRVIVELGWRLCEGSHSLTVRCPILLGTSEKRMKDYPKLQLQEE